MTTGMRAFRGTVVGLLWALLALPGAMTFAPHHGGAAEYLVLCFVMTLILSPFIAVLFGPGAFLLSYIHATQMERWASRARAPREVRKISVLLGMPLGVGSLILPLWVVAFFGGWLNELTLKPELLFLAIPALAGGAGMGWGVTSELTPPRPRPRPVIRRNGPPFFDDRRRAA